MRELEGARLDLLSRARDVLEHDVDVDAAVPWPICAEATFSLLELTLAAWSIAAAGLVPGDGDVDEPLEEVALGRGRRAPFVLELLVSFEVLRGTDELDAPLESHPSIIRIRAGC